MFSNLQITVNGKQFVPGFKHLYFLKRIIAVYYFEYNNNYLLFFNMALMNTLKQKIRTIKLDSKTVKLQIVSTQCGLIKLFIIVTHKYKIV